MWQTIIQNVLQTKTHWKQYYAEQGIDLQNINTEEQFNQLPVLRKSDLPQMQQQQLPFAGFVQEEEVARIFVSPGPIYDPQGEDRDYWLFAPLLEKLGVNHNDIVQNTFSYHLSPAGFMFDSAARHRGARVIPAGTGNSELQVQVMKDLQTTVYAGTPSFLVHLLNIANEKGYRLGWELALKKAVFTAEKVTKEMDERFDQLGIEYLDTYGTADIGAIAYREPGQSSFTLMDHLFIQLCDPDTGVELPEGELGEIVISMSSHVYPLLRFGTGDLSFWVEKGKRIAGVIGRASDSFKVKGMFVHAHQLEKAISKISDIEYYQATIERVKGQDQMVIYIECNPSGVNDDWLTADFSHWEEKLKEGIRVRPTLRLVEKGSLSREEKQLIDLRS